MKEQKFESVNNDQKVIVCPPTTFERLLDSNFEGVTRKELWKYPIQIARIFKNWQSYYFALVDLPLKGAKLGRLLHHLSPYGRRDAYSYDHGGIWGDLRMPDQQELRYFRELLAKHQAAFPQEWKQLELDRPILLKALQGETTLFPLISWVKNSKGQRRYNLDDTPQTLFLRFYAQIKSSPKFGLPLPAKKDRLRVFNPNLGLILLVWYYYFLKLIIPV